MVRSIDLISRARSIRAAILHAWKIGARSLAINRRRAVRFRGVSGWGEAGMLRVQIFIEGRGERIREHAARVSQTTVLQRSRRNERYVKVEVVFITRHSSLAIKPCVRNSSINSYISGYYICSPCFSCYVSRCAQHIARFHFHRIVTATRNASASFTRRPVRVSNHCGFPPRFPR